MMFLGKKAKGSNSGKKKEVKDGHEVQDIAYQGKENQYSGSENFYAFLLKFWLSLLVIIF